MKTTVAMFLITAVLVVGIIVLPLVINFDLLTKVSVFIGVLSSAATVGLLGVTVIYVYATNKMVEEMRKTRLQEFRPEVVVYFEPDPKFPEFFNLAVCNIGRGLATDVKFKFEPEPLGSNKSHVKEIGYFADGIETFVPGAKLTTFYDSFNDALSGAAGSTKCFKVEVLYRDSTRAFPYHETYTCDVQVFRNILDGHTDTMERSLEKMVDKMGNIARCIVAASKGT